MAQPCRACGSPSTGAFVCHYCGAATQTMTDPAMERQALDELHGQLAAGGESEKILQNAFVPTNTEVLIDAGLRLLPVLEQGVAEDGAAGRLRAIIIKLELLASEPAAKKAAAELRQALEDYRRSDRLMGYWVLGLLFAAVAGVAYWIWG